MIEADVYRIQGIEPWDKKIVVVKSWNGLLSEYGPFAARIIMVDTSGVCSVNLRALPNRRLLRPTYPLDALDFDPENR